MRLGEVKMKLFVLLMVLCILITYAPATAVAEDVESAGGETQVENTGEVRSENTIGEAQAEDIAEGVQADDEGNQPEEDVKESPDGQTGEKEETKDKENEKKTKEEDNNGQVLLIDGTDPAVLHLKAAGGALKSASTGSKLDPTKIKKVSWVHSSWSWLITAQKNKADGTHVRKITSVKDDEGNELLDQDGITAGYVYCTEPGTNTPEDLHFGHQFGASDGEYEAKNGETVQSMADLAGKKIVASGQGSTPEYALNYLLEKNGLTGQVEVEYVSEHDEAVSALVAGKADLVMIPEPKVTAALSQLETARVAISLTDEWDKVSDTQMITGVLVVQKAFANEHPEILKAFLEEYEASVKFTNENPQEASQLIEKYGIIPKAPVALKALPNCNIVYIDGSEMAAAVTAMLTTLFDANPASVGGSLPGEEMFYESHS